MKHKKTSSTVVKLTGEVNWFDVHSGKGSIAGDDGILYRIHEFSEIQSAKAKTLREKVRVEFELANDSIHPIIRTVRTLEKRKQTPARTQRRKPDRESEI